MNFVWTQMFDFAKYTLMNAYNSLGSLLMNHNLFRVSLGLFGDQLYHFPINVPSLERSGDFNFNWRMTADPKIEDQHLDLAFYADIGPDLDHCLVTQDTHDYYFDNTGN